MSRTITRLFDDYSDAKAAVNELERLGVPHSDLSIVANNTHGDHDVTDVNAHGDVTRGASTGAALGGVGGLLAGLGLLAIPGLGPIVAAGWLASTAAGAAIGGVGGAATGGIVGALKNAGHSEEDAHVYSEGVRRGGTLVSARVSDDLASQAESVLNRRGVDAGTRGAAYRQSGWTAFDDKAPAYTRDEIERERSAYREPSVM
ncbi:general stress protein [Sphingomonas pituitosa]|uniref:general stress protein n=1 Tax=Sphingomonas pituitosa TaxID=99597 RepID=UPI00082C09DB|nr:general stress protein [Sphingomonas pituitosa]